MIASLSSYPRVSFLSYSSSLFNSLTNGYSMCLSSSCILLCDHRRQMGPRTAAITVLMSIPYVQDTADLLSSLRWLSLRSRDFSFDVPVETCEKLICNLKNTHRSLSRRSLPRGSLPRRSLLLSTVASTSAKSLSSSIDRENSRNH